MLNLSIKIKAEEVDDIRDIRWILEQLASRIEDGQTGRHVLDINGNRIGTFKLTR